MEVVPVHVTKGTPAGVPQLPVELHQDRSIADVTQAGPASRLALARGQAVGPFDVTQPHHLQHAQGSFAHVPEQPPHEVAPREGLETVQLPEQPVRSRPAGIDHIGERPHRPVGITADDVQRSSLGCRPWRIPDGREGRAGTQHRPWPRLHMACPVGNHQLHLADRLPPPATDAAVSRPSAAPSPAARMASHLTVSGVSSFVLVTTRPLPARTQKPWDSTRRTMSSEKPTMRHWASDRAPAWAALNCLKLWGTGVRGVMG